MGVGVLLVDEVVGAVAGGAHGRRLDDGHLHVGMGLQAEGEDRDANEEDGEDAYYLQRKARVRGGGHGDELEDDDVVRFVSKKIYREINKSRVSFIHFDKKLLL